MRALCSSELGAHIPCVLKLACQDPIVVTEYMEGGDVEHFMFRCLGLIGGFMAADCSNFVGHFSQRWEVALSMDFRAFRDSRCSGLRAFRVCDGAAAF